MASGNDLRLAIKGKDITFEDAAKKIGISRNNLYIQTKKAELDEDFIKNVNEKLGVDLIFERKKVSSKGKENLSLAELGILLLETTANQKVLLSAVSEIIANQKNSTSTTVLSDLEKVADSELKNLKKQYGFLES